MKLRWLVSIVLFLRAGLVLAQEIILPYNEPKSGIIYNQVLPDSLRALDRYRQAGQAAAGERVATYLLSRYPGRVAYNGAGVTLIYYPNYPQNAYTHRANLRSMQGNFRGAEADLTQAIAYTNRQADATRRADTDFYNYNGAEVSLLREAHYARALLRLDQLRNPAGACADMATSYQHDTVRAGNAHWRGCPLPSARLPLGWGIQWVKPIGYDSLTRAQRYLTTGQTARAAHLLAQLRGGRVGPYCAVPVSAFAPANHPEKNLALLESYLLRKQGNLRRATEIVDSLADDAPGITLFRYERGILRIDYEKNRTKGCDDLRWVYDHDSSRTGRAHPRWRGCPLPRYKVPIGPVETSAYERAFRDSLNLANQLLNKNAPAPALRLLNQLLTTAVAGRYAPASPPRAGASPQAALPSPDLQRLAHNTRARAYLDLARYSQAEAELDTLIRNFDTAQSDFYCRRGELRADFLNNQTGACEDLTRCRDRQQRPNGTPTWRKCDLAPYKPAYPAHQSLISEALEAAYLSDFHPVWQVGLFRQGALTGVQASRLFTNDEEWSETLYGPSVGLDISGNSENFVLAPKLSYEAMFAVVGGRLDLSYNLNQNITGDLRLTPQIGLGVFGLLNLYYGYGFHVAGTRLDALGNHRLSLYINFLHIGKFGG